MGKAIAFDPNVRTGRNGRAELDVRQLVADAIESDRRARILFDFAASLGAGIPTLWEEANVAASSHEKQSEEGRGEAHIFESGRCGREAFDASVSSSAGMTQIPALAQCVITIVKTTAFFQA